MGMHKGMCGPGRENNGPSTPDVYLRDYIARKIDKPRLTFEQWVVQICGNNKPLKQPFEDWFICMQEAWKAAQENV